MNLRSPLSQARGLGSAKSGTGHWWAQRVTAIALVPLALWFVWGLVAHAGAGYGSVLAWLGSPLVAVTMLLFLSALFYHSVLGVQVVIEDYVHGEGVKIVALLLSKFAHFALAAACIFSVLQIAFA